MRRAGIPAPDSDVERVLADGSLERMEEHARAIGIDAGNENPDYLERRLEPREGSSVPESYPPAPAPEPASLSEGAPPRTIAKLALLVREGIVSPVEITERALAAIDLRDAELNAFQLVLRRRAMEAARRAEAEIAGGSYRGPLHGIPIAVKDLFAMRGTPTSAGSTFLGSDPLTAHSAVAARLEAAGAVIVGKTRLPEFAFWPGSSNPHYGPTRNPLDPLRDAGGSSSGSAVAVAAGMAYGAVGSDTGGSIRIPAALCGVVGLKPTYGMVDLSGCVPLAWSLDHAGPLTRCVDDAALFLNVLAGHEVAAPFSSRAPSGGARSPAAGLRVAVLGTKASSQPLASDDALRAWQASNEALGEAGAELIEVSLPEMSALRAANLLILMVEAATFHAPMLRRHYDAYGEPCRTRLLAGFAFSGVDFVAAQGFRRMVRRRWSEALEGVDVLSTPCQPDVAPPLGQPGSTRFTAPFNALGWPAISVPFGHDSEGLPYATQLVGKAWQEGRVVRAARILEAAHDELPVSGDTPSLA